MATMQNTQPAQKIRTLKVYEKVTLYNLYYGYSSAARYPEIRLIGKWLADCGFQPGQYVDVAIEQNKLTITHSFFCNEETNLKPSNYEKQKAAKIKALVERASAQTRE
ncbi:MAG: SymE family type I addiction module toxin [Niabella sp.]